MFTASHLGKQSVTACSTLADVAGTHHTCTKAKSLPCPRHQLLLSTLFAREQTAVHVLHSTLTPNAHQDTTPSVASGFESAAAQLSEALVAV